MIGFARWALRNGGCDIKVKASGALRGEWRLDKKKKKKRRLRPEFSFKPRADFHSCDLFISSSAHCCQQASFVNLWRMRTSENQNHFVNYGKNRLMHLLEWFVSYRWGRLNAHLRRDKGEQSFEIERHSSRYESWRRVLQIRRLSYK